MVILKLTPRQVLLVKHALEYLKEYGDLNFHDGLSGVGGPEDFKSVEELINQLEILKTA